MSAATERAAAKRVLAGHCLMTYAEAAHFLQVDTETVSALVRDGLLPAVPRGRGRVRTAKGIDPMDLAVYALAGRAGVTVEAYWERHGDSAADHARRYVERIRRMVA